MYQPEVDQLKHLLDYDPGTGVFHWKVASGKAAKGGAAGYKDPHGYIIIRSRGRAYKAHRLAWLFVKGTWPKEQIDHANGVREDNRIENLRECSGLENQQNRKRNRNNTSGYMGVSFKKKEGMFYASIRHTGKNLHLGAYKTAEAASEAYKAAKRALHAFQPVTREGAA